MTQDKEPVAYIAPSSFWQIHWIVAGASSSFRGEGEGDNSYRNPTIYIANFNSSGGLSIYIIIINQPAINQSIKGYEVITCGAH